MRQSNNHSIRAVSTIIFAAAVVVLIVIAGVGFGLYYTKSTTSSTAASSSEIVTSLAYSHWAAIGNANLTATLSQYSSSADLWWYVHGSALNTTTTAYTGSAISATWTKFFSNGPTYWTVNNFGITFPSSTSAKVTAVVWFVLGHGNAANATHTLDLPYELDYSYQSGQWQLTGDWWGLPSNPGFASLGVVAPVTSSTTTLTTTIATTTSSTSSTTPAGGGGY